MINKFMDSMSSVPWNVVLKGNSGETRSFLNPLTVAIARLADSELSRLSREDLIDLVNYSILDGLSISGRARLNFADDVQLMRLACLARYTCRRKVNSVFFENGLKSPFLECV